MLENLTPAYIVRTNVVRWNIAKMITTHSAISKNLFRQYLFNSNNGNTTQRKTFLS